MNTYAAAGSGPDPARPAPGVLPVDTTVDVRDQGAQVAVLPIGSFEQHGAFLPLATDTLVATAIAGAVAAAHPVLSLPPLTISCSHEHAAWPGTVSISAHTLYAVVRDVANSLSRSGIGKLVVINGHGGNYVLGNVVQESAGEMALFPGLPDWDVAHRAAGLRTPLDSDMHGGELETSILLHAYPGIVKPGYESSDWLADDRRHLLTLGMAGYTDSGVVGQPSYATAQKGKALLASLVTSFADYLGVLGA